MSLSIFRHLRICTVVAALGLGGVVAGCATPGPLGGPGLQLDQYTQRWVFNGEPFIPGGLASSLVTSLLSGVDSIAWFRGTFDTAGRDPVIQLLIKMEGKGAGLMWATSARDATGATLEISRVEQRMQATVLGSTMLAPREIVAITTPREFLEQRKTTGLDIQLMGVNGQASVIKVPADAIPRYLADFDAAVAKKRS
jgi:hypothetical protein